MYSLFYFICNICYCRKDIKESIYIPRRMNIYTKTIELRSPTPSNNFILDCCCGILSTPLAIVKLLTSYILISVFILPPYNVGVVDCCMRIKILLSYYPRCHQLSAVFGITPSARMVDCCVSLAVNSLD